MPVTPPTDEDLARIAADYGFHYDDATCLRTARAVEAAVGGFPSPPGIGAC